MASRSRGFGGCVGMASEVALAFEGEELEDALGDLMAGSGPAGYAAADDITEAGLFEVVIEAARLRT